MTIYLDADGCPVVNETIAIAQRHSVEVVLLCDTSHEFCREGARTITVSKGADSVDYALVNLLAAGDLAVTQDYGLAAMCLARGAKVLNQNGMIFSDGNIGSLLEQRAMAGRLRRSGKHLKGAAKRTPEQTAAFCEVLEQLLSHA
ncbi:MAG: YaiI/YqxD family protein [Pygmaiobacter sp.]